MAKLTIRKTIRFSEAMAKAIKIMAKDKKVSESEIIRNAVVKEITAGNKCI